MSKGPMLLKDCENGEQLEVDLPFVWEICPCCDGHGTDRGASVERDGGGFTASEWAEEDDEFKEEYLSGFYDRPCRECNGSGKVKVADYSYMLPEDIEAYEQQLSDDADFRAMCAAERRMGA